MAMRNQPVGDHHAVTVKVHALRAHVCGAPFIREFQQLADTVTKFFCKHVIRIIAEAVTAYRDMRGIIADLLAASAELLHPEITDSSLRQCRLQGLTIEVWQAARNGDGPDVDQGAYFVRLQGGDQLVQGPGGVTNGVKSGHCLLDCKSIAAVARKAFHYTRKPSLG